jgi:Ppx/GppA phosphatase family
MTTLITNFKGEKMLFITKIKRNIISITALLTIGLMFSSNSMAGKNTYCAVEVGSKGVKARGFQFGIKDIESSSIRTFFEENENTTIIASMKDGLLSESAISETADMVASLIKKMRAIESNCKAFVVGSSGVANAKNHSELANIVKQRVDDLDDMDFISGKEEAEYGFIASVPQQFWYSSVIIDIGSGNTKIGYMNKKNEFKADEIPFGSVTLTKKAAYGGENFSKELDLIINSSVRPSLREVSLRIPGLMNQKNVYWIGGAAWSTANFMRPDQSLRDVVMMNNADIKRFIAALNDKTWINYKPSNKSSIKVRNAFDKNSVKVLETFSRDNLLSGVSIFDAFLNDRGVDGPIRFVRNGSWIMGYASKKYVDNIWDDEALN